MAKKSNHRTVVFLTDYATKKAGEEWACDGMLARSLVNAGVAEYKKEVAIEADDAPFFINLPEITEENSGSEKVSEPVKTDAGEAAAVKVSKQKSSTKSKGLK